MIAGPMERAVAKHWQRAARGKRRLTCAGAARNLRRWPCGVGRAALAVRDAMLLIPHHVAPGWIHGLGCFASVSVAKGARIRGFHPVIDRVIPQADLDSLPDHVVRLVHTHAEFIPETAIFRLASDGACFMNHSDDGNLTGFGDWMIARRDIAAGEELTCDDRGVKVLAFSLEAQADVRPAQTVAASVAQE